MISLAWILARKDLALFFRDRTAVALSFLLPLVLGSVFGAAMGAVFGGGGGRAGAPAPRVELGVEDQDMSPQSIALVERLSQSRGLRLESGPDVRRKVAGGELPVGLRIPAGYGSGSAEGGASLVLYLDPGRSLSTQVALMHLAPVLIEARARALGPKWMDQVVAWMGLDDEIREPAALTLRHAYTEMERILGAPRDGATPGSEPVASTRSEGLDWSAQLPGLLGLELLDVAGPSARSMPAAGGASHAFSSMAVMMLLFSVAGAGGTLLQERHSGTLTRLELTPAAGSAVLLGKLFFVSLVALLQLALLFGFGAVVFGVPVLEAPGHLALVSVTWVALAVGIGLVFAVLCRTQKQLEGSSTLVILVMSAVGGAWFPREITPAWFQALGSFTPVAWAMDAYHGVLWYGKSVLPSAELPGLWPQLVLMLAGATFSIALAAHLWRRRARQP